MSYKDDFHCFTLDFCYVEILKENKPISVYQCEGKTVLGMFVCFF